MIAFYIYPQEEKIKNLPDFYHRRYHFGFLLGFNVADFGIDYDLRKTEKVLAVRNKPSGGFHLGTIAALRLYKYWLIYFIPEFILTERIVQYEISDSIQNKEIIRLWQKNVESSYLSFSLDVHYRSERLNNFSMYWLGGFSYAIDLASQRKVDNSVNPPEKQVIPIKRHNIFFHAGAGIEFYLQYFKFGLEYKFSFSLLNVLNKDETIFSAPLDALRPKLHLISFTFEG